MSINYATIVSIRSYFKLIDWNALSRATIVTDNYHLVNIVAKDTSLTKRMLNLSRVGF